MRVLIFVGFLLVYFAWLWAGNVVRKLNERAAVKGGTFWVGQLSLLLGLVPLFGFVLVLTGYFDWVLMAAFFAASQISTLLFVIGNGLFGSSSPKLKPRAAWLGGEVAIKNLPMVAVIMVLCMLFIAAFPVFIGIAYFSLPAAELPVRISQYALAITFVTSFPVMMAMMIRALVSENLDENTRVYFFIGQMGALIPSSLWVALLLSSFGVAGPGRSVDVGNTSLTFSPLLLGVLIVVFVLPVLISFFIGGQRAKQLRTELLARQQRWMAKLKDILGAPSAAQYVPRVTEFRADLDRETTKFIADDRMIKIGDQITSGFTPGGHEAMAPAYKLARDLDPRFRHLDWLRDLARKVDDILTRLGKLTTEKALEESAKDWVGHLQQHEQALQKEYDEARKKRTPVALICSVIILPIISGVVGGIGTWLWTQLSESLQK